MRVATTLEEAAAIAAGIAAGREPRDLQLPAADLDRLVGEQARGLDPGQRFVRGLFSGGTLAWEAVMLLSERLPDVAPGVSGEGTGHRVVDLGEDVFTVGRPHPMIDGTVRREWIIRAAADPTTAVLLLDLVLGHGAHPDPAAELLPALDSVRRTAAGDGRRVAVVASVTGTDEDPQRRSAQVATLRKAGVAVMESNAQAARLAALIAARLG
jgi:FdrA protein